MENSSTPECCSVESKNRWYRNKAVIVIIILAFLIGLSYVFSLLVPFREILFLYIRTVWLAMLLGLVLGGVIEYFVPEQYIIQILSHKRKRTVLYAVGLGFFSSACSCGVLALAIQLYKKGASTASTIAFLLASPWANLPLTIILIGFFGLIKAFYIILSAIIVAIITGFIFRFLEAKGIVERNKQIFEYEQGFSILSDIRSRFAGYRMTTQQLQKDVRGIFQGSMALADMVLWWVLIGMGLASLAGAYIPSHIFQQYMGPSIFGMLVTLFVATIMEVCSEGTAPLAFEVFRQTGALGNALVFLMAGVATDYTEIGLLWHNVGRRTAIWLPVVAVPQIILFGIIANLIF